jgi:hypothetical protein
MISMTAGLVVPIITRSGFMNLHRGTFFEKLRIAELIEGISVLDWIHLLTILCANRHSAFGHDNL